MRRANLPLFFFIIGLTALALWIDWPQKPENYLPPILPWPSNPGIHIKVGSWEFHRQGFRLGLDLQGGTNLVYQADLSKIEPQDREPAMNALVHTIERRVNAFGVTEAVVQRLGNDRVAVQLPGVRDIEEAKRLIGQTAQLIFKERTYDPSGNPTDKETGLTGADLRRAYPCTDELGRPAVCLEFNDRGTQIWADVTTRLAGRSDAAVAIFLDNELLTAPVVRTPILQGRTIIEGNFTLDSARLLATQLNSGALPVPIRVIRQEDVGATLGADSVRKSLVAGSLGIAAVMVFMVGYYRFPGLVADVALGIYALLVLAIFKLIPVTLTLAGIAGFILSVGMAVDANILIFERMREELRAGRTLGAALEAGFNRAWTSIRDSNISTLITCAILWVFASSLGTPLLQGFALTLAIGVVISMFSAITVTRNFMRLAHELWFARPDALESPIVRFLFDVEPEVAKRVTAQVWRPAGR